MGFGFRAGPLDGRLTFFLSRCSGYSRILSCVFRAPPFHLSPLCPIRIARSFALAVHAPNRILWLLAGGRPATLSMNIVDLRQTTVRQIEPLLLEEARHWREELHWDYRSATDLIKRFLEAPLFRAAWL